MDSLRRASMIGFNNISRIDWFEDEYANRYFKDVPSVAENLPMDTTISFLVGLQPNIRNIGNLIDQYESLLPKIQAFQRLAKKTELILHDLRKRKQAHQLFESNLQ
jgi:hypothetical protein